MPKRIQRKRTRGWKMPLGVVFVGRPSKFRNPCRVGVDVQTNEQAVFHFRRQLTPLFIQTIKAELRDKDLACWCPLDQPCHADVLLEIANG